MFCCRELLFSKLFYRHQQQQPPLPVLRAAAGNRICRQMLFFYFSVDNLSTNAVFLVDFFCRQSVDKCCFLLFFVVFLLLLLLLLLLLDIFPEISRRHVREFFRMVLDLARPSEPYSVLLPGATFFEAVLLASAAAAAATSSASSRRQQNLSTLLVLQSHGVLLPGAAFFEAVLSASAVRISDDTLCFAAGSCFFRSCFAGISSSSRRHHFCEQPQATESLDNLSTSAVFFLRFQTTR